MRRKYKYTYVVEFTVDAEDKDECDEIAADFAGGIAVFSDGMQFGKRTSHDGFEDTVTSEDTDYDCDSNEEVSEQDPSEGDQLAIEYLSAAS